MLRDVEMRYPGPGRRFVFVPKHAYVIIWGSTLCLQELGCATSPWTEIASFDRRFLVGPSCGLFLYEEITGIEIQPHISTVHAM